MKLSEETEEVVHQECYIELCELMSPNDPEFDNILEKLEEQKLDSLYNEMTKD